MGDIVGIVIFLAVVVISIARNLQQQKRQSNRPTKPLTRADVPEAHRRQLYGDPGQTAQRKGPERKSSDSTEPQSSTSRQLFEALFGDEEVDWEPVPPQRSELPRQAPPPPVEKPPPLPQSPASAPIRQQKPAVRREPKKEPARSSPRQRKPRPPSRGSAPAYAARTLDRAQHQMHRHAPGRHPTPVAVKRPSKKLFAKKDDLRRAIVLREVLGPPKAME